MKTDLNVEELAEQYRNGLSIPEIAAIHHAAKSTVRLRLIRHGVALRSAAEGTRMSAWKISNSLLGVKHGPMSDSTKQKLRVARLGTGCGFSIKRTGYVQITTGPNKGRGQHVVIMEKIIGRRLTKDEVVHHIDGDKQNNSPRNLMLMTRAGHTKFHRNKQLQEAA